jgi:FixJ family two-component response regulator
VPRSSNGVPMAGRSSVPTAGQAPTKWVALVDDHESMRTSIARALRLEGICTVAFASAEEYLDHSAPKAPCCLVLDMQLPGMRGLELAQFLDRERPPLPSTIFITGHEDLWASLDGNILVHGRLRKPFELEELLRLVNPLVCGGAPAWAGPNLH